MSSLGTAQPLNWSTKLFYPLLLAVAVLGFTLGWRVGTPVYDSKVGTVCGVTLCVVAWALLIWQLFLLPHNLLPVRIALPVIVLVMSTCTGGDASPRNGKRSITGRQGAFALFCILGGAFAFSLMYSL